MACSGTALLFYFYWYIAYNYHSALNGERIRSLYRKFIGKRETIWKKPRRNDKPALEQDVLNVWTGLNWFKNIMMNLFDL
jgi:hypothetical protein